VRIVFKDVAFAYSGHAVLDGFSAVIEPGRVTALVGPSGSGKSTALAAIGGYHDPVAGEITLQDASGRHHGPGQRHVCWVPQNAAVMSRRSVLDNVLVAPLAAGLDLDEAREIAQIVLGQVGLVGRFGSLAGSLSGGEKQRVAFARALASARPVLLADEPTSSLDARSTGDIARILADMTSSSTVVVATHDPLVIDSADAVVALRGAHGA